MSKTLDEWLFESAQSLPEGASADLHHALITVCYRVHDVDRTLFVKITNKRKLQQAAKELSLKAETDNELEATAHLLTCLYDHHKQNCRDLIEPKVSLPLRNERPLIDNSTPTIATIEALHCILYHTHPASKLRNASITDVEDASLGHAILTVVFRSGLTSIKEFDGLLQLPMEQWVVISKPYPLISAYLPHHHKRVYLLEEAVLAMHKVLNVFTGLSDNKKKQRLRSALTTWKSYAIKECSPHLTASIDALSIHDIVKYIAFMHQSCGVSHGWPSHHALKHHSFVRAFTGHDIPYSRTEKKRQRSTQMNNVRWESKGVNTSLIDTHQQEQLKNALKHYALHSPKQRRDSIAYKSTSKYLSQLIQPPSQWTNALLTHWITSLFLYGSPWKKKLRVNSLLNYHSTVQRFIEAAWTTGNEIKATTSQFEICCQYGLNQIINADEQRTILRFLTFCAQHDAFPPIEIDAFELINGQKVTRAHYIPPQRFDDICANYSHHRNSTSFPIVLIMQLCYYAGLREDEALSLSIKDIDFETGMLYVTADKIRKSQAAIRKIPLDLLPSSVLKVLTEHINTQIQQQVTVRYDERTLFDNTLYPPMEKDFIAHLRHALKDNSVVTHSFRHCAANNWLYLLALVVFEPKIETFLGQHVLFSDETQKRIKQIFSDNGHELTPYFPIIDWISNTIGHSSASITITHYLHILDWVSLVITHQRLPITKAALRFWTSESNYGFERQKQLFNTSNNRSTSETLDIEALNTWLTRHWRQSTHLAPASISNKTEKKKALLTMANFNQELSKLEDKHSNGTCHPSIIEWLKASCATPAHFSPKSRQIHAWLKLCASLDLLSTLDALAVSTEQQRIRKFSQLLVSQKTVTKKRDLLCLLKTYERFGLPTITLKLTAGESATAIQQWGALIHRFDANYELFVDKSRTNASVRPYKLRWSLWGDLEAITTLIGDYLDYLAFTQEKTVNTDKIKYRQSDNK